jgi:type IV secretory pathway VirB6-like protein
VDCPGNAKQLISNHLEKYVFMKIISGILVIFTTILLSACYYDSEEYLFPQLSNTCDTTQVTFALGVKPILQNSCYSCHSNTTFAFGNNIRLEDYADVKTRADNGSLLGSISHAGGYAAMPQGSAKLEDCKITIVIKWIETGAPNN